MLFPLLQIHKQAPPLEDIAEDCSPAMRSFLERALEKNPRLRSSAAELLRDEAVNPAREDQPRCWSLDSALGEASHPLLRQHSQLPDTTQGEMSQTYTHTHAWAHTYARRHTWTHPYQHQLFLTHMYRQTCPHIQHIQACANPQKSAYTHLYT